MRILILGINFWPEEAGIGAFTTYRAEYLARQGHDVTVCTTFAYYPDWKLSPKDKGRWTATESHNGVQILRSYAYIPNPVTSLKRVLHEASFVAGSFLRAFSIQRPDLLLVVSPPLGLALSAIVLSRWWGIPYVFDVMDLQPDAAADLEMLPPWVLRVMYTLERMAYRNAALVSTLTKGMRARIIQKGFAAEKVILFEPRADDALLEIPLREGAVFRRKYELDGKFIVTHSGNFGVKQGLDVILDAAEMCRDDASLVFLLVGNGAARQRIERRAAELGLDNVRFMPLLNAQEFRGLLAASDVCLITQRKSVSDIVFPSKVVSYLAAGCAVIASVNACSEIAQAVLESNAGTVVESENASALRDAICAMRAHGLRDRQRNARAYASKRWSSTRVLQYFEKSLVSVSSAVPASLAKQGITQ